MGRRDDDVPAGRDGWTELARRVEGALDVTLLWLRAGDRIKIAVVDERTGERFELDVRAPDALSAFYHPFAFRLARRRRPGAAAGRARFSRRVSDAPAANPWDDAEEWA
jgi:hypothetical protein